MSRMNWALLTLAIIAVLIVFFPLRLALAMVGTEGISARNISGTIWGGRAEAARIGALGLGSLDIGLDPLALMAGRARLSFHRSEGAGEPLSGAVSVGFGGRSLDHLSGVVHGFSPPVEAMRFDDFSVRFANGQCHEASGRVQVNLALNIAGLDLRHGLSGDATCRGSALFVPLVGQSGMERINLSVNEDGSYTAQLSIRSPDPILAAALVAAGLTATNDGFGMTMRGRF